MAARIGIDTGGTFTDVVRWSPQRLWMHKLPSTPRDPAQAVLDGLAAVRRHDRQAVDVVHGTTVGLNAVLTSTVARTVFVTNRGFEDLIAIGRQERSELYALAPSRPVPPVPPALRLGVRCRRGPDGQVEEPLTAAEIGRAVAAVVRRRPQAVAIGLLHSPVDDADEQALARAVRRALPDVPVTCSAELSPAVGEYERFCAAILNAAIAPVVGGYTARLAAGIGNGRLRLLRSSLGVMPPAEAAAFPARAMFSGPAGGVLATAAFARQAGLDRVCAFDMGGTSADVCLVDGDDAVHDDGSIAGLPLPIPGVAVHTVGCGGGSIAYRDRGGALRVGPQSAGADPGPACYGRGDEPTVTDAHAALGHLGACTLLGGAMQIDVDAAVRAIERLGRRLGLSTARTARGILAVAEATMARAILRITAERAIDPAGVTLCAYGGAGGLHAAGLVAHLGMRAAFVPPLPGAFSALGLALAGSAVECAAAVREDLGPAALRRLAAVARRLRTSALESLDGRGRVAVQAYVRYRGQGAALRVPFGAGLARAFRRAHLARFGFAIDGGIEVIRLVARAEAPARRLPLVVDDGSAAPRATPATRRSPLGGPPLPVVTRDDLRRRRAGPLVVEEPSATTVVPAGFAVERHGLGLRLAPAP
jgi:N-methylhydantoinase A